MSELPFPKTALYTAARRRQRRRRRHRSWRGGGGTGRGGDGRAPARRGPRRTPPPAHSSTTIKNGIEVSLPPHWFIARETLTPRLSDPHEVLSIATFPLTFQRAAATTGPTEPPPA